MICLMNTLQRVIFLCVLLNLSKTSLAWRRFLGGRTNGSLGDASTSESHDKLNEIWFKQRLDHSDPTDMRTWQQRCLVNSTHYQPGGPVFVMIGPETAINVKWMVGGQWLHYAQQYGAMTFLLEHRFYGKSHPTPDLSVENLKYLTSEQALADLAHFIRKMSRLYRFPVRTKWIAFGGSYGGSLAAWMRAKYPHLVHGAVSSSGPLLAQIEFQEYLVVVENSFGTHSQACVDAISSATNEIGSMLHHPIGQQSLTAKFHLCDPIDPSDRRDISNLFNILEDHMAGVVQYNDDNSMSSTNKNYMINRVCDILVDERKGVPVDRLAEVSSLLIESTGKKCLEYKYSKMIDELRNTSWEAETAKGNRQWFYQSCTEFGFFQTSTARPHLFSDTFPIEFIVQQCTDVFGPKFDIFLLAKGVERTNMNYGGLDLQVSNVVYVHGSIDPWHPLGITKSSNPQAPAIYINGTAHIADVYEARSTDLPQLVAARQEIGNLIGQWLDSSNPNIRHDHQRNN